MTMHLNTVHLQAVTKKRPAEAHIDLSVLNPTWAAKLQEAYGLAESLLARFEKL